MSPDIDDLAVDKMFAAFLHGEPRWQPLVQVPRLTAAEVAARIERIKAISDTELSEDAIRHTTADLELEDRWVNDRYQVYVARHQPAEGMSFAIVHLTISRLDGRPVRDWRDMQRIKNQLVGPECEGVELFPAESRLLDAANAYHLWVVDDPAFQWPLGWDAPRCVTSERPE